MTEHCDLHFVGSLPLDDARNVFATLGTRFGPHLRRIPDGETGPRTFWVQSQGRVFAASPQFEPVSSEGDWRNRFAPGGARHEVQYRIRPGVDPGSIRFGELGYAAAALASHEDFRALKRDGIIPIGCRFMVAIPTPYNVMSWGVVPEARLAVEPAYRASLLDEIRRICAAIPHAELAIQWDCAHDMQAFDGARKTYFDPAREGIIERLARLGDGIPPAVELGYHFCYGSFGGRHFVEPKTTAAMVDLANAILGSIGRTVEWLHLPVPIERDDDAYFAPLAKLRPPPATLLYLGLIHERDGVAGARRRIAAAERHYREFGLATECGYGRMAPEAVPAILAAHEEILRACCLGKTPSPAGRGGRGGMIRAHR